MSVSTRWDLSCSCSNARIADNAQINTCARSTGEPKSGQAIAEKKKHTIPGFIEKEGMGAPKSGMHSLGCGGFLSRPFRAYAPSFHLLCSALIIGTIGQLFLTCIGIKAGSVLVAVLVSLINFWSRKAEEQHPPIILPFFSTALEILANKHRLYDWVLDRSKRYGGPTGLGTWRIRVMTGHAACFINDPVNVEHVLRNVDTYGKGRLWRRV